MSKTYILPYSSMTTAEIGLLAITAYAIGFTGQVAYSKTLAWKAFLLILSCVALLCHGMQLHLLIDVPGGQNLSWVNLLSLLTWLSALLIFLTDFILPVASLNLLIYPSAIIAIGLTEFSHTSFILETQYHPQTLIHILLATLIVTLLVICGLQAFLLTLQQACLKRKKMLSLLQLLPPMQIMQRLLFFEIALCFIGLTLFLVLSLINFDWQMISSFWCEAILSLVLWLIFLILLVGRFWLKWRSATAAIWITLSVVVALLLFLTTHMR